MQQQFCPIHKLQHVIETLKKKALYSNLQYKHSAGLIHKYRIISSGFNKYIPISSKGNNNIISKTDLKTSIHAEIDAILQTDTKSKSKFIRGLDIIIIRIKELSNGDIVLKNSRPCNSCIDKMRTYGIRKVYYSNDKGDIVYEFLEEMPKLHTSSGSILKNYISNISIDEIKTSDNLERELNKLRNEIRCY